MLAYVKSRKTFATTYKDIAQTWDVPIMASTHERGTITIPLGDRKDFAGDLVYFHDHIFMVEESSPNDGLIELTVSDPINLFSRELIYPEEFNGQSYGDFIEQVITDEFILCSDSAYAFDYLEVVNTDTTEFEAPKVNDTGLYSLVDVIAEARKKGVLFQFYIANKSKLVLDISSPTTVPHNIIFDDGPTSLENETFSRKKIAKITTLHSTEEQGVYDTATWYLSTSGEVSQDIPDSRADGDWIYLTVQQEDDPEEKAKEKFKENIQSHKIEFHSNRLYYLWDTVRFVIDGETLESAVIGIYLSSDDKRYLYKCGDLATTLTEKIQKSS